MAYNLDYLLDNLHKMNFTIIVAEMIIGYMVIVGIYSVFTYIRHFSRYEKAKKSVKEYYTKLGELAKAYGESDQDQGLTEPAGGKNR